MKFCASVCELNPLHGGHARLIRKMKESGDKVVLFMSGNFCQRGEAAVIDKYTRAKHAVFAGADAVFELPSVFSSSPAEMFASGAIKLLAALPDEKTLYFGTEKGTKGDFLRIAEATAEESKEFKAALKTRLADGSPHALARTLALEDVGVDASLLKTPNAVLGVEYVKAILKTDAAISFHPVERTGSHGSLELDDEYVSSSAIRNAIAEGKKRKIKKYLPKYVYADLPSSLPDYGKIAMFSLLEKSAKDLREITDCSEGLENRVKVTLRASSELNELIDKLETRRYTRARISRIITNSMLGVTKELTEKCLKSKLYLKVLAIAEDSLDLLSTFSSAKYPLITRKSDGDKLGGVALQCFERDAFAGDVYSLITGKRINEYEMKVVTRTGVK